MSMRRSRPSEEINDWAKRLKVDSAAELTALRDDVAGLSASVGDLVRRQAAAASGPDQTLAASKLKLEEKANEAVDHIKKGVVARMSVVAALGVTAAIFALAGNHRGCGALRAAGARLWGISGARHRRRGSGRDRVGLGQCCDDCSARENKFAAPLTKPASASEMGRTSHAVFPEQGHYANDPEVLASYPPAEIQLDQISDLLNYEQSALLKRLRREAPAFVCVPRDRCLVSDSIAIPALVRMFLALG
jgi:hypothetical protein